MSKKWILMVDDEPDVVESVRELLYLNFGEDNIKVVEASNGIEATTKVKNQKFDCIITDMKMPKKEGDALIVSIRQNPFNEDTPIIMLTANPNKKILNEYRFVYLLEKPFLHGDLTDLVGTQMNLGNKGDRLAADMVNNLVIAAQKFLATALKSDEVVVESPSAKRYGDEVSEDIVSLVNLYDDGVHNSFAILISEASIEKLAEQMPNLKNIDLNRMGFGLGQTILSHAVRKMHGRGQLNYNIKGLGKKEAAETLRPKKGILIPLKCGEINFSILACGEKKKAMAS